MIKTLLIYEGILTVPHYDPVPSFDRSSTVSNTSRPLITSDEVMRLPENEQIVFMKGIKPINCFRLSYYEFTNLQERSKIKPPYNVHFV